MYDGAQMNDGCVQSLMDICLQLVASNLDRVDSLQGFPELVGEQLATAAAASGLFSSLNSRSLRALDLLNQAYPGKPLSSVSLYGERYFDEWLPALQLVVADLSCFQLISCSLNSADQLIQQLSAATRLRRLILRDCRLTDGLVQRLTVRGRSLGSCLQRLHVLDVRDNFQLTFASVKRLLRLKPRLLTISLALQEEEMIYVERAGYQRLDRQPAGIDPGQVTCDGWLSETLWRSWVISATQPASSTAKFYGSGKTDSSRRKPNSPYSTPGLRRIPGNRNQQNIFLQLLDGP